MKKFEDEFMDIQSGLVSLGMEVLEGRKVNRLFIYCSNEEKSVMFNAFCETDGGVRTMNEMGVDKHLNIQFLTEGNKDLLQLREICQSHNRPVPTEMKLVYEANTGKYHADYKYEEICSAKTGIAAEEVFLQWISEVKSVE